MLPIVEVPESIRQGMEKYREVFYRDEGFEHVSRYVTGLVISPNKTLQGIYDLQVWEQEGPSRRAMHAAVFEANWDDNELMIKHREVISHDHRGKGREVISIDWTLSHHERGPKIFAITRGWDYIENRVSRYQTVITAVIVNRKLVDGLEIVVQEPDISKEEEEYLKQTVKESYQQMEQVRERLIELLYHLEHKLKYRKRTEIAIEIIKQIEEEGNFPQANYAFDSGVLTKQLTKLIEGRSKHWVSEIECNRHINWQGEWRRVDEVAAELRTKHPESFRLVNVRCRNGEVKQYWAFTKVVRLKKLGRKRLVVVHEQQDLQDEPRFLLTDALHWESGRVIETWSYRWGSEIFHEFTKQVTGLESAQVRNEEAVKRHFRLSCVAQSLIQRASAEASKSERFDFAKEKLTFGQRRRAIAREVLIGLLKRAKHMFEQGLSCDQVLEVLMPA